MNSLCLKCFQPYKNSKLYLEFPNLVNSVDPWKGCLENSNMVNSVRQSQMSQKYKLKYLNLKNIF